MKDLINHRGLLGLGYSSSGLLRSWFSSSCLNPASEPQETEADWIPSLHGVSKQMLHFASEEPGVI